MSLTIKSADRSDRIEAIDGPSLCADLDAQGWAILPKLLSHEACDAIAGLYGTGADFAAMSSWPGTASDAANIAISPIRCRRWWRVCAARSMRGSRQSPMTGTKGWRWRSAFLPTTRPSSSAAIARGKSRPTPLLLSVWPG